jgi:hypothetical protein
MARPTKKPATGGTGCGSGEQIHASQNAEDHAPDPKRKKGHKRYLHVAPNGTDIWVRGRPIGMVILEVERFDDGYEYCWVQSSFLRPPGSGWVQWVKEPQRAQWRRPANQPGRQRRGGG